MTRLRGALDPVRKQLQLERRRFDELVEYVRYVWQRAMEELMCDMGCAAVFGPAAVFAGMMLHMGGNLDEPPSAEGSFYPSPRFRLREVLRYAFQALDNDATESADAHAAQPDVKPVARFAGVLKDRGFAWAHDLVQEQFEMIKAEVRKETDLPEINQNPLLKMAYEQVERSLGEAWDHVRNKATSAGTLWLETIDDVPDLLRSIELLVPPGEIRQRTDDDANRLRIRSPSLSAIAIAMWLCQLREDGARNPKLGDDELGVYHRLCRLMLKAFEDVELRLEYDSSEQPTVGTSQPKGVGHSDGRPDA
jgi:hypothetical protein